MRLLVVSQYFWPENFRINDLVSELVLRGHQVTVLTGQPNYPDGEIFAEFAREPGRFARYAGAEIVRVPLLPRGKSSVQMVLNYLSFVLTGLTLGVWKLRGLPFDAIFVFQVSPVTSALPALLLRRLKRAPLLMWVLDLWPETLEAVGVLRSPRALGWMGALVGFIYRRCELVLVQSRAFMASVEKYAGSADRIRYFPGWAEAIFEGPLEAIEPAPEVLPYADTFNVLFAGNVGDAQDFPAILDAAALLRNEPNLRWLIVGDGRSADWVRSEITRRDLGQQVILLGRHPIDRMPAFFRGASALLVTLKKDPIFAMTIPGKVQSYLATGLPIVAMLDGEGAAVIAQAGAGFVCGSGVAPELARCVQKMMRLGPAERAAMGASGRAYGEREFQRAALMTTFEGWAQGLVAAAAKVRP